MVALFVLVLVTRLVVATAEPRNLIAADVYQDDAFYYLGIARHITQGSGPSFDGEHTTNAFHPLYLALLLPVVAAAGGDPWLPVRASTLLLALIALASAPLVYGIGRRVASERAARLGLAVFAVSPTFTTLGVNGQETGVAFFAALLLVWLYLRGPVTTLRLGPRPAAALGAAAGLAVLARSDLALLALAIAIDWMRRALRARALPDALRAAAVAGVVSLVVWGAWGVPSRALANAWLPTSGAASNEIAKHFGWSNLRPVFGPTDALDPGARAAAQAQADAAPAGPVPEGALTAEAPAAQIDIDARLFDPRSPPAAWYADVAAKALFVYAFEHPLLAPLRANVPFSPWPGLARYWPYRSFASAGAWLQSRSGSSGLAISCSALAAAALALLIARALRALRGGREPVLGWVVPIYTALAFLGYVFVAPAHWYFTRYLALPILLGMLGSLGLLEQTLATAGERGLRWPALLAVAGAAFVVSFPAWQLVRFRAGPLAAHPPAARGFLASWEALSPALPADARIGAFQAGIYGWFGGGRVVNLDGKVNPAAQRALAAQRPLEYVLESGIDYVIDQPAVVRALCTRHDPVASRRALRPVAQEARRGGAALYRVLRDANGAQGASAPRARPTPGRAERAR